MMLAEAVNDTRDGPLADFRMTEKDRYELKIAGLLHDCGKITTPVHVVDKATKLQTIFDRIELVDTRFEVLKRDAEIEMLRAKLDARASTATSASARPRRARRYAPRCAQLDDDREFLRRMQHRQRAHDARGPGARRADRRATRWRERAGDDRATSCTEDEVKNLTIRAARSPRTSARSSTTTSSPTIKMLEALPWPQHLPNVPEYAGGHHERMDGKGYPQGPHARADVACRRA